MTEDDVLQEIERESQARSARVKALLIAEGRQDLADELDTKLRDIRLGVDGAQSAWHSISAPQRRVLSALAEGRTLVRAPASKTRYGAIGLPDAIADLCSVATVRALCSRELLAPDGGAFDPERRIVLTERGRFVVRHGPLEA